MQTDVLSLLCSLPALVIALTFHEFSHGWMANRLGDPSAKNAGRLSLNPLRHLDVAGALCMLFFRIGWAKPVPVNPNNFKKPKRDMALTALAGPVSNLLLGLLGVFLFSVVTGHMDVYESSGSIYYTKGSEWQLAVYLMLQYFYYLNLALAVFNFLPIPPLDGSRIFLTFLPTRAYFRIMRYERYIMMGMFGYFILCRVVLSVFQININVVSLFLSFVINLIERGMFSLVGMLPFV